MKLHPMLPVLPLLLVGAICHAEPPPTLMQHTPTWPPEESLLQEVRATITRGADYLASLQQEDGHWSNPTFPALTGLALWALIDSGWNDEIAMKKAVEYILSCVHEDGSIYRAPQQQQKGGGLSNYNTAISMVALHKVGDPALNRTILNARTWLANSQHLGGDVYRGGMGYDADTGRPYTDLSNSYIAYEAMRLTEDVEDLRPEGEEKADLDWEAAREFVERVHNNPDVNDQPWVADDEENRGGFAYHPDNTRAGTFTNAEGVVKFRSFGSMTYAGLLSYIYADVDKEDPRVVSTFQWATRNFVLDENPGTGKEGLYYYLNVLAKGLHQYGQDTIYPVDGEPFIWRTALIKQLLSSYRTNEAGGVYWINETSRYWESDPVLVTAYALIAMEYALD